MLNVSKVFSTKIDAHSRAMKAIVTMDFVPGVVVKSTITTSSEAVGYPITELLRGRISFDATRDTGKYLPDYVKKPFEGWRSATKSDENGLFATPIDINIVLDKEITAANFWVVGTAEEHPVDFTFRIYDAAGNVTYTESVEGNTEAIWNPEVPFPIASKRIAIQILRNNIGGKEALLLNAGLITSLVLTDEELVDLELLEEVTSDEALPYGGVSSNELAFSVDNLKSYFSPAFLQGPLAGLIGPGVVVQGYLGLEVSPLSFEYVPLGTFMVAEWRAPSQGVDAAITAYDRLYDLNQEPVPMLRMERNTTVAKLFGKLFISLGIPSEEFEIDNNINAIIPYGYVPQGTVGEALNYLCQAGLCRVRIARNNKIIVSSRDITKKATVRWTDEKQILAIDNPEKLNAIFGRVSVSINEPSLRRSTDLASMSNIGIPPGAVHLENAEFSKNPVMLVESVNINKVDKIQVGTAAYGTHHLSVTMGNQSSAIEFVSVSVQGIYCDFIKRELVKEIPSAKMKKQLTISNDLIQTATHAQTIMNTILPTVADTFSMFEMDVRGNPALELGDIINFTAPTIKVSDEYIEVFRIVLRYDGSIDGVISGRKIK